MSKSVHVCSFDVTSDLKKLTYGTVKERVLAAGRFSVFDATRSQKMARIFQALESDPEIVCTRIGFPWIKVERKSP
jgi:hypothetical protein